jgi:hypothetical protein
MCTLDNIRPFTEAAWNTRAGAARGRQASHILLHSVGIPGPPPARSFRRILSLYLFLCSSQAYGAHLRPRFAD